MGTRNRDREKTVIISRAPTRFSLGGGATDIPAYYEQFGGYLIAGAIDKYVYVSANSRFYSDIRLSYSKTETVPSVDKIEHRIFREALRMTGINNGIELTSVGEVATNSGLNSSSSFTVALLNELNKYRLAYTGRSRRAAVPTDGPSPSELASSSSASRSDSAVVPPCLRAKSASNAR